MTDVQCYIKYAPYTVDVSGAVFDRVDIWRKATDGIGSYTVKLKNDNGEWLGQFGADDPIQIRINDTIFLEGFLDKGTPLAESREAVIKRMYELVGRDYGQDLQNKIVNKTGDWAYEPKPADDIVEDMLTKASSYIQFGGLDSAPQIQYTDRGDEYLQEAFRKIMEKINWDYHITEDKLLWMFPIGYYDSGIRLKNLAGDLNNNILDLQKVEFDAYELRNYVIAKADNIEDGWTDGNAADFTGASGNTISNEFTIVRAGATSIKSAKGTSTYCELNLSFPRYNYDFLPFNLFGSETIPFWIYPDIPEGYGPFGLYVILTDTNNKKIEYVFHTQDKKKNQWEGNQYSFAAGTEVPISKRAVEEAWVYLEGATTFNWQIKNICVRLVGSQNVINALILDDMRIPLPMVAYKQDGTSEGLYKTRHVITAAKDYRSQKELDDYAASELEKLKNPIQGLKIIAVGTAGVSLEGENLWIPGYCLKVNSPQDGINDVWYRMTEIHVAVAEYPLFKGHDFIAEITLVPYQTPVSGKRLSYVESPEIALFRGLSDEVRFLEKKEEAKRDFFPAMPGPIGEKIMVGDFVALSDMAISWTRRWEEEKFTNIHDNCSIVDDVQAANLKSLKIPSGAYIAFKTPYFTGQVSGDFYVVFALKVSVNTSTSNICNVWVYASGQIRGQFIIKPNDFPVANKWHHFALRVRIEADDTTVYAALTRYTLAGVDLYCDFVALLPADIPLGYADVTVSGHAGTNVNPHSGTETNPHTGTAAAYAPEATSIAQFSGTMVNLTFTIPSISGAYKLALFYKASFGTNVERLIFIRCTNCNTNYLVKYVKRGSFDVDECGSLILVDNHAGHEFWFITYDLSGTEVSTYKYVRVIDFGSHSHSMTNPSDHSVTQPSDHSVTQPSDHTSPDTGHEH